MNISPFVKQYAAALFCAGWLQLGFLTAQEQPADGIHWATESGDGVLTGLILSPNGGVIGANQPLELQFVLKNTTQERKRIECTPIATLLLDLRADNVLSLRGYVRSAAATELEIDPGEVVEPQAFRLSVSTAQMLPGAYTIDSLIGVWAKDKTQAGNKEVSLGTMRKIAFTISNDPFQAAPIVYPPEESDVVFWGEPLMGISVGAQLVRVEEDGALIEKSQRFHLNETLMLQLFLHNHRESEVTLEVIRARIGDPWELSVFTQHKKRRLLRQMNRDVVVYQPVGLFTVQPGEQVPLTGVPIEAVSSRGAPELDVIESATFSHAGLDLVAVGDRKLHNPWPLLEADLGNYFASATVRIQLRRTEFSAAITTGLVPFRVVDNPFLPETGKPPQR